MWLDKTDGNPEPAISDQFAEIQSFGIMASPTESKKGKTKRIRWSESETRNMLRLYEIFTLASTSDSDVKSQADVCRSVETEMRKRGSDKSWHQIKDRYTNLRVVYLKSQGMQRSACIGMSSASEFFDQISRIVELEGKHIRIRRTDEALCKSVVIPNALKLSNELGSSQSEESTSEETDLNSNPPVKSTIAVPNRKVQSVLHAALVRKRKKKAANSEQNCDPNHGTVLDSRDTHLSLTKSDISVECSDCNNDHHFSKKRRKNQRNSSGTPANGRPKESHPTNNLEEFVEYLNKENVHLKNERDYILEKYRSLASSIITVSYLQSMQIMVLKSLNSCPFDFELD
ncbi:uncharacterized protein LOC136030472 isoform X2 [Artemia franciscana]|uniref:uncharacterized protein LOC136030472 isoform X2 n=1 Tax=Artemia franciscana TaxID=6661 RepID=UPI0032DA4624